MKTSFDLSGAQFSCIREFAIASATVIAKGAVVKLVGGLVVLAAAGETGAILGITEEDHVGGTVTDIFNTRSNGKKIFVKCSSTQAFNGQAQKIVAGAVVGATSVAAVALNVFADDDLNGGYIKLVAKATASTNPAALGTITPITDFTKSGGVITAAVTATTGDTYEVYPPIGFAGGNFNATATDVIITATAALPIAVLGYDFDLSRVIYIPKLHAFATSRT